LLSKELLDNRQELFEPAVTTFSVCFQRVKLAGVISLCAGMSRQAIPSFLAPHYYPERQNKTCNDFE
jgi:hypothetical protein